MYPFRLAPDVYACASDDGGVFLDVSTGNYLGVDAVQARALSIVVEGWPLAAGQSADEAEVSGASELARVLCERHLLEQAGAGSTYRVLRPEIAEGLPGVRSELVAWEHMAWRHINPLHVLRFVKALLIALFLVKCRHFSGVVRRDRARKARYGRAGLNVEKTCALLSAFFHIRAFFYAPKDRCLLDSLTLLEFLAAYGQHPRWVVGVQVVPFGAHSWIQHDGFVLNGTPEYVRAYTPILVI